MYVALEVLTVMLTAVTMSLALAQPLELPGKLRLGKEQYLTVQTIYNTRPALVPFKAGKGSAELSGSVDRKAGMRGDGR